MEGQIILKAICTEDHWIAYGPGYEDENAKEVVAKVGPFPQKYFPNLVIEEIDDDRIVISEGTDGSKRVLTRQSSVSFHYEIEGREWSDGCVCDGSDYYAQIIWE